MDRNEVFDAWAPPAGRWSPWVKPVLFAHIDEVTKFPPLKRPAWAHTDFALTAPADTHYRSSTRGLSAVVVDLPGVEGVAAGMALYDLGFQPVPLYSSQPGPDPDAIVPMEEVLAGLSAGALELRQRPVSADAPPAFLLDERRSAEGVAHRPGQFDNRSASFPSDFPSARKLEDAGIETILLIQGHRSEPRLDLVRTLLPWQDSGLRVLLLRTDLDDAPRPIRVRLPGVLAHFGLWWRELGFHGNSQLGFGGRVQGG